MLLFLYSDKIESLQWKIANQLCCEADKCQTEGSLLFLSVRKPHLHQSWRSLASADTRSDSDLKKSVEDFILEHEEEVFGSKEWELLMEKILG
ncbi:hypothetical protein AVEN_229874-1 [Araneus ventricosus]|uniref:Uncharacterized protein n=1 Tax=Araneus ventricosus TaxID=182803 RepID=A0A4Y2R9S1_ARAVE|nr:hypothetical protein AVEN_180759-1 [Araneus ventricosus]GBN72514.1 hypothetical protein AVEN_229874-1 [Araneus ventricosus]